MDLNLNNERIFITGSTSGIGLGIAMEFLSEGANVVINGRDKRKLENKIEDLSDKYGKSVEGILGDISLEKTRQKIYEKFKKDGINHVICNVGSGRSKNLFEEDSEEWHRVYEINTVQASLIVNIAFPLLKNNQENKSITFIGSICGMESIGCPPAYSSAKAGLIAYMKNLTFPLGKHNIRVNMVSPGNIIFPGSTWEKKLKGNRESVNNMLASNVALKRLGETKDISSIVTFLSSSKASFITGSNIVADGGQIRGF